jgi:hypothetical protein
VIREAFLPMSYVLVRVTVADYRKWKRVMEDHIPKRMELGSKGTRIFRDAEHPERILCLTEWGSFAKAREFMSWGDPGEIHKHSTAEGSPEVLFLEHVDTFRA